MTTPRATRAYENREAQLVEEFRKNVRRIALRLAHHEQGNTVLDVKHADTAFDCLNRFGLSQQPWYRSPTFEVTIGGACLATALAAPDLVPVFVSGQLARTATFVIVSASAILATLFYVHGWTRHSRP